MGLNDVVINRLSGGLGRREPSEDGISGIISNVTPLVGSTFDLDSPYKLRSLADAEPLGITESFSAQDENLLWFAIHQYFQQTTSPLWIYLVEKTLDYDNMIAAISKFVPATNGEVKQLGLVINNMFDEDGIVINTGDETNIMGVQDELNMLAQRHYPCIAITEISIAPDADYNDTNLRNLNASGVSVVGGFDYRIYSSIRYSVKKRGDVGTVLGAVSRAKVHENIGWVQKFNLQGEYLTTPSLGGGKLSDIPQSFLENANDKGLIFFRQHIGYPGIYVNDSHTCTALTDDYAYIENNRTMNKAHRLIRKAFLPYLNSPIYVDPNTGQLAANTVAMLEAVGNKTITDEMLTPGEVSGFSFTIDPSQDILATSELVASLSVIPVGTARKITINIGFSNPFNS